MSEKNTDNSIVHSSRWSKIFLFLFCVLISTGIWIYVINGSTENYEKSFQISLTIEGRDDLMDDYGMTLYDWTDDIVTVTVSGKRNDIQDLDSSDFRAFIDVSGLDEAKNYSVPVKVSNPQGVSLVSCSPDNIDVSIDVLKEKEIPVVIEIDSYSNDAYHSIGEKKSNVSTITVKGPSKVLDKMVEAVAHVNLDNQWLTGSFEHTAALHIRDANKFEVESPFVSLNVSSAKITVEVLEKAKVSLQYELADGFDVSKIESVSFSPSSIDIMGKAELVSLIKSVVAGKISENTPSESVISISSLSLPDGISYVGNDKQIKMTVTYKTADTEAAETTAVTEPVTEPVTTN